MRAALCASVTAKQGEEGRRQGQREREEERKLVRVGEGEAAPGIIPRSFARRCCCLIFILTWLKLLFLLLLLLLLFLLLLLWLCWLQVFCE